LEIHVPTATQSEPVSKTIWNVPNQLTLARLFLSIVLFVLLQFEQFMVGMVIFLIAAGTDWIDGYWARKYGQVTKLGRVLDPFVDKIIICGAFIFLASFSGSGITAWMAVIVVGRELLVTALRSFLEGEGADFSAVMSGKLKMVLQCAAVAISMFALSYGAMSRPEWVSIALTISVWSAVVLTVYSGVEYVRRAVQLASGK
jgi:CDP-diacylglycerol---glycerol-3-phosphate 3-phosphatidyltransferase